MEQDNNNLLLLKAKLVSQITKEELGEECAIICEAITKRNKIPLSQICEILKPQLNEKSIKYLLIVLIKNGIVQYESSSQGNYYFVNSQSAFSFMRGPSYLLHVKQLFGPDAELIVEFFLNNSQGSFEDCFQSVLMDRQKASQGEKKERQLKEQLKESFVILIKGNYLQKFEPCSSAQNNDILLKELEEPPVQAKLNAKRKKEEKDPLEAPKRKVQKKNIIEDDDALFNDPIEIVKPKEGKRETKDSYGDQYLISNPITKEGLVYKLNVRQFIHDFRSDEIAKLAEGKLNVQARNIIKAMLESSQKIGKSTEIKTSEFLSLEEIKAKLVKSGGKEGLLMKDEDLQKILRVMKRDGGKFIEIDFINGKEVYSVNLEKIVSKMKIRHTAKIIERKYDLIAGRIFRILKKHKHLNEKAISDISLQSLKDTQRYLNLLSVDGYIQYMEIKEKDKIVNVMSLYKYDEREVMAKTIGQYYQGLLNLKTRLQYSYKRERELEEEKKIKADDTNIKKQWQQIIKTIMNLEMAIIELDQALLIFTEF